jgi:hypothetical protein
MEREMTERMKRIVAAALCHRAMHGLAAGVYGASAAGILGKEAAGWALCVTYAVIAGRGR